MKNNLIYALIIIIITIISIYLLLTIPVKKISIKIKTKENNEFYNIKYYKQKNLKRYKEYQKHNLDLTKEQVVLNVNMNLDYDFYTHVQKASNTNSNFVLVNKYYYLDKDYIPNDLEEVNDGYSNGEKFLIKEAKTAFENMAASAATKNLHIRVVSAYRDYAYQEKLYNDYAQNDGKKNADTYSARPGFSEHQTGLALDLDNITIDYNNFEQTDEFKWMQENAYKYGFILRFPKNKTKITGYLYEPWHYRYVGRDAAEYIHRNNLTLEEYYAKEIEK